MLAVIDADETAAVFAKVDTINLAPPPNCYFTISTGEWSLTLDGRGRVYQERNGKRRRLWFGPRKRFVKVFEACHRVMTEAHE